MTLIDLTAMPEVLKTISLAQVTGYKYKAVIESYIEKLPEIIKTRQGLLLWGSYGTGKSSLAAIILMKATEVGICGFWVSCKSLPGYVIKETIWREGITYYERALTTPLLVLDELQIREDKLNFVESCVEDLLRARVSANKPTIITTNHVPSLIKASYPALFSVLEECVLPVKIEGMNFRHANGGIVDKHVWSGE